VMPMTKQCIANNSHIPRHAADLIDPVLLRRQITRSVISDTSTRGKDKLLWTCSFNNDPAHSHQRTFSPGDLARADPWPSPMPEQPGRLHGWPGSGEPWPMLARSSRAPDRSLWASLGLVSEELEVQVGLGLVE